MMENFRFIFLFLFCISSCKKSNGLKIERDLDATNLTPCSTQGCNFVYSEWRDIVPDINNLVIGKFRVFRVELNENGLQSTFFIKASMDGIVFRLDSKDLEGMAAWDVRCSSCRIIGLKPIQGTVRGSRIIKEENSEVEKWVLDINIILSDGYSTKRILKIKQIFYPDFYKPDILQ